MKYKILAGTTSFIARIFINDATSIIGAGLSGVLYNSTGFSGYYSRVGDSSVTNISFATATAGTFTTGGFIALDNVKMPGVYELGIPNSALAVGAPRVNLLLYGANNMVPCPIEIELDKIDYQTSVQDAVWNSPISGYPTNGTFGSGMNKVAEDVYFSNIKYVKDATVPEDEYTVSWYKNNQILSSGQITNPALSVFQTSNGNAIFSNGVMTYATPSLGVVRYNYNTAASLLASGEPYIVMASGTIDGATRTWGQLVGLDYL